jgi:hypothetical protein
MSLQTEMMEIGKERLTQMKVFLEDLQVQMALGKAEARDTFDRERKNVTEYVREMKTQAKKTEKNGKDHRQILKDKLTIFNNQIIKDAPGSKRSYDQWKKNTLQAIYELEFAIKEGYSTVGYSMQTKLDIFKPKLDAYRIQLALGNFEAFEELVKPMADLLSRLDEMDEKLNKEEKASEKIDTFAEEMNQSFDHMKKAFGELFS